MRSPWTAQRDHTEVRAQPLHPDLNAELWVRFCATQLGAPEAQRALCETGGLIVLLNHAYSDDSQPLLREAAIFAIREVLAGNVECQAEARALIAQRNAHILTEGLGTPVLPEETEL